MKSDKRFRLLCGASLLFLSSSHLVVHAGVELRLTSMDGVKIHQAHIGVPFLCEVVISDLEQPEANPSIEGLDNFNPRLTGNIAHWINGRSIKKFVYELRIDKQGVYIIGPARVTCGGKAYNSDTLSVVVVPRAPVAKGTDSSPLLTEINLNKKEVTVGEKVILSLSVYYNDSIDEQTTKISNPEFHDFEVGKQTGPVQKEVTINGNNYHKLEWTFELTPQISGELTIPAYIVDYFIKKRKYAFWNQWERCRACSNAEQLTVYPLPLHDPPVEAVGKFTSFSAIIDPPVAKEGEGMVLSLLLEGEGNFEKINTLELLHIPEGLKYYDSKQTVTRDPYTQKGSKCFEYIVQALQHGDYEIPSQELYYFDVHDKIYKLLKTAPILISIVPSRDIKRINTHKEEPEQTITHENSESKKIELYPLNTSGSWYTVRQSALSWYLFFLLFLFPLFYYIFYGVKEIRLFVLQRFAEQLQARQAFNVTAQKIDQAVDNEHIELYQLFIDLFASRLHVPANLVSQKYIEEKLKAAGWPSEQINGWNDFFNKIMQLTYAGHIRNERKDLIDQARIWLIRFKKVI